MNVSDFNFSDLAFSLEEGFYTQRQAYRAAVSGIDVRVEDDDGLYEALDVSANGCSMRVPDAHYAEGRLLSVQLEIKGRPLIRALTLRIVRVAPDGAVACAFQNLTRQQEYALDKLVLEIQKRIIALHKTS